MLPYAQLRPGPGFQPFRAAMYYSQRLVVEPVTRDLITRSIATAIHLRGHGGPKLVSGPAKDALMALRRDGLTGLPAIPTVTINALLARLEDEAVIAPNGKALSLEDARRGAVLAAYPMATILACPEVFDAANDPLVLEIVGNYLGCRPTISSLGIRWSFARETGLAVTQSFHRDRDDWRSVKYFIYLTDVEADTGPHVYVKGSHRTRCGVRAKPYGEEEVASRYGEAAVTPVTGHRGTAFLADTFGIHKGASPKRAGRLILQIQYSVLPVYAFRYKPQPMQLPEGSDRYMYRLLAH